MLRSADSGKVGPLGGLFRKFTLETRKTLIIQGCIGNRCHLPRPLLRRRQQHRHKPNHPGGVSHPRLLQPRRVREARLPRAGRPPGFLQATLHRSRGDKDEVLNRHRRGELRVRFVAGARAGVSGSDRGEGVGGAVA
ncbi:unnamed protein product [Brassica oleracea var. botrytis]